MEDRYVSGFEKDSQLTRRVQPAELAQGDVLLAPSGSRSVTASVVDLTNGKMLP